MNAVHELIFLSVLSCVYCKISEEFAQMHIIDESIMENLRNNSEKQYDIFEDLESYKDTLYQAYQIVLHHNRWEIDDATFVYKMGKPRFLSETVDTARLSKLQDWNVGHFTQFEFLISEIKNLWNNFENQYELMKKLYNL